ncbi:putative nucleotidyltransferase, ribonuclease H [Tanacetum coccineum]
MLKSLVISAMKHVPDFSGCQGFLAYVMDTSLEIEFLALRNFPVLKPISKASLSYRHLLNEELKGAEFGDVGDGLFDQCLLGVHIDLCDLDYHSATSSCDENRQIIRIHQRLKLSTMARPTTVTELDGRVRCLCGSMSVRESLRELKLDDWCLLDLALPSGSDAFLIYSDASKKGLGLFLLCVFDATMGDLLYGEACEYIYSHKSLKYIFTQRELNIETEKRGMELLKDYELPSVPSARLLRFWWLLGRNVEDGKHTEFSVDDDGVVWFEDRLCVPNDQALREKVMTEVIVLNLYLSRLNQNVQEDLKQIWWNDMKQDSGTFVSKCYGLDPKFTSHFWKGLQKAWGTRLKFSTAFHPQTDGQSERTIQTLEDMLRACALEWTGSWDEYLCLVEFAYNNSWHASIKAAPFELLYGRKCRAPICWDEVGEHLIEGPELIKITNEKVAVAKEKLKEARSRQKSYADKHRHDLEFQVGDRVFLKVSPFRGVKRFGIKGKLSPRFIDSFEILERIGEVSYRLALPPQLSHVHDVIHVSLLRGYHYHPLHVASYPFDQIQPDMSLSEEPESILDRQERVMRNPVGNYRFEDYKTYMPK